MLAIGELELVDVRGGEGLRHGLIVVIEAFGAHAGVLAEGVVLAEPLLDGFHPRIVRAELGVDQREQAGVGNGAVGTERGAAVGKLVLARLALVGAVGEAALVLVGLGGEVLVIGLLEILAARQEGDRGVPVELRLLAVLAVLDDLLGERERLDGEVGVRHVGAVVVRAVADAAVVLVVGLALFADVPLLADEVVAALDDGGLEIPAVRRGQRGDGGGGVVNGKSLVVDAAVFLLLLEQPVKAFGDGCGQVAFGIETRLADHGGEGKGGECRQVGVVPMAVLLLLFGQPRVAAGDGLLHFDLQRQVAVVGFLGRGEGQRGNEGEADGGFHGFAAGFKKGAMVTVTFVPSGGTRLGKGNQTSSELLSSPEKLISAVLLRKIAAMSPEPSAMNLPS